MIAEVGYLITDGERYLKDHTGHDVTTDRDKAYIWSNEESAKNALENSLSTLFKKQGMFHVEQEKRCVTPMDEETKTLCNSVLALITEFKEIKKELDDAPQRLSEVDKKLTDLLHYVEMTDQNAANGYKLYKKIKELRVERRNIKRLIYLRSVFNNIQIDSNSTEQITKTIKNFEHEKYTSRMLDLKDILDI